MTRLWSQTSSTPTSILNLTNTARNSLRHLCHSHPISSTGWSRGQETSIEIEPGKTLIIKLNAIGKLHDDGTRAVYFELNGNNRSVVVRGSINQEQRRLP